MMVHTVNSIDHHTPLRRIQANAEAIASLKGFVVKDVSVTYKL